MDEPSGPIKTVPVFAKSTRVISTKLSVTWLIDSERLMT